MTTYYNENQNRELRNAFEGYVLGWPYVTIKTMFGCPAYLANGKLFAFLVNDGVVIAQIRTRDREKLNEIFETQVFQAGEREIDRWFQVHIDNVKRLPRMINYVKKSYAFVLGDKPNQPFIDLG